MNRRKTVLDFDGDFDSFVPRKKGFHNTSGVVQQAIQDKKVIGIQPKVTGAVFNSGGVGTANPGALGGGVVRGGGQSVTSTGTSSSNTTPVNIGVGTGGIGLGGVGNSNVGLGGGVTSNSTAQINTPIINTQGLIAEAVKKELASNPIVNQPTYTSGLLAGIGMGALAGNPSLSSGGGGASSPESLDEEIAGDNQRAALVQKPEKRNSLPFIFGGVVIIGLYLIFSKK